MILILILLLGVFLPLMYVILESCFMYLLPDCPWITPLVFCAAIILSILNFIIEIKSSDSDRE